MNKPSITKVLFSILLLATALACNLGAPGEPPGQPSQDASTAIPESSNTATALCDNPFYPVELNTTWAYKSVGSPVGEYTYTETITDVRADGFTITSDHVSFTRMQEWSCTLEGLLALTLDDGSSAGISSDQFQMDLTTKNISGVSLPASIKPGDHWTQTTEYEGNGNIGGTAVTSQGTMSSNFESLGEESVTVPGGTFNAMKLKLDLTNDVQLTMQGLITPSSSKFSMVLWWAPNIGLVKTNTAAELPSGAYTETIELQSYNIP